MSKNFIKPTLQNGNKVMFDKNKLPDFIQETTSTEKVISDYQKLVLKGIDQVGTITEVGEDLTTVNYPDGWQIPVPTKYLLIINEEE